MEKYFTIIRQSHVNPELYLYCGTGFFINNNGLFVTAGHVFRNAKNLNCKVFICFPTKKELVNIYPIDNYNVISRRPVEVKGIIRDHHKFHKGPIFKDLAFGFVNLKQKGYYNFQRFRPESGSYLTMPCYQKNKKYCPAKEFPLLEGLFDSQIVTYQNKQLQVENSFNKSRIPIFELTDINESIDLYNNCIEVFGEGVKGNSGAPILDSKDKLYGIYVGGNHYIGIGNALLANYIWKKIGVKRIKGKK